MMMRIAYRFLVAGISILVISAGASVAKTPGLQVSLDLSQGFSFGDNLSASSEPTGDGFVSETDLAFSLTSETRRDSFQMDLGARYKVGDLPDEGGWVNEIIDPFAKLAYTRQGRGSSFTIGYATSKIELQDSVISLLDLDTLEVTDLVIEAGSRSDNRLNMEFISGTDGPVETSLSLRFDDRTYDSTDASLIDRKLWTFNGAVRLAATRNTDVVFSTRLSEENREDANLTDFRNARYTVGIETDIDPATRLVAGLGTSHISVDEGIGTARTTKDYDSLVGSFSLKRAVKNGTAEVKLESDHTRAGTRQTLRLTRAMDLPAGSLSFTAGGIWEETGQTSALYELAYTKAYKRAALQANLDQVASSNVSGQTFLNTSVKLRYVQELSVLSHLDLRVAFTDIRETSNAANGDSRRLSASASFNYSITDDWMFTTGVRHTDTSSNGNTTLRSNELFANVSRSFDLRF